MQVRQQQLELDMEQQTDSKQEKEYVKAVYCHPAYLTYMHSKYIMRNARLEETQAGIKISGRNINNLRYADDTTLVAENEEELKSLLKVKEESKKVGLKLNIQKTKIMVPSLHGKQMGKQWKQCQTLFFWAPKSLQMVTAAMKSKDACSLEEKL